MLAWLVHLYTASGSVFAFLALLQINHHHWSQAMAWLLLCLFIDGTDGFLARKWKVGTVLPTMDGTQIDHVIDFLAYAFIPACFIYESGMVHESLALPTVIYVLVISAMYYGKKGMVSEEQHFNGFPVLWNLVVFYAFFVFRLGEMFNLIMIALFGILHFIPIKVSYPSHNLSRSKIPFILSFVMIVVLLAILYLYPMQNIWLTTVAVSAFIYFIYLSIKYTWLSDKSA